MKRWQAHHTLPVILCVVRNPWRVWPALSLRPLSPQVPALCCWSLGTADWGPCCVVAGPTLQSLRLVKKIVLCLQHRLVKASVGGIIEVVGYSFQNGRLQSLSRIM
jgi:hypothetical protein